MAVYVYLQKKTRLITSQIRRTSFTSADRGKYSALFVNNYTRIKMELQLWLIYQPEGVSRGRVLSHKMSRNERASCLPVVLLSLRVPSCITVTHPCCCCIHTPKHWPPDSLLPDQPFPTSLNSAFSIPPAFFTSDPGGPENTLHLGPPPAICSPITPHTWVPGGWVSIPPALCEAVSHIHCVLWAVNS